MNKILKAFVFSFFTLLIAVFVVAIFLPHEYKISRSVEIKAPVSKIFSLVADFSRWKEWSPWYEMEPTAKYAQEGTMGAIGSVSRWDGRIIGKGSMTLVQIQDLQKLTLNLKFEKPRPTESVSEFTFESKNGSTIVTWTDRGSLKYPMGRLFGPFLDNMIGGDFGHGLSKLKECVEKPLHT